MYTSREVREEKRERKKKKNREQLGHREGAVWLLR
jgi:hypothetical protein